MGGCCSCCCGGGDEEGTTTRETELAAQQVAAAAAKSLSVSRKMSASTIKLADTDHCVVTGHGLAVIGAALEQDAAYWEWHIHLPARKHVDTCLFGVTSKKDRSFYQELEGKSPSGDDEEEEG
jgi:hypothetical protein